MVIRADDFVNKNLFLFFAEQAQARGLLLDGPLSWDEDNSVTNLHELELEVSVTGITGTDGKIKKY